ncbi:hypothetical protein BCU12_20400 [Vibrio sp. 10N.261.55.A7]|nr:hypothetical protein BCU12_20400 [Vibrio sp. 10N.261.55.A7]
MHFIKAEILYELWISDKNKKNCKWALTDEERTGETVESYRYVIGLFITRNENIFLDLYVK